MTGGVITIDQGATNTKASVIEASESIVARASIPVTATHPQPGWAEQSGDEIWQSVQPAGECLAVLQGPLRRSWVAELSAIGAGIMAGSGVGLWREGQTLAGPSADTDIFAPVADETSRRRLIADWRTAVRQAIVGTREVRS